MNYTLQVLKGRSEVGALRMIDGVNSVGRSDDCVIRIRSSQVSRRHCEIFEADGRLIVRDLGSSNGTFVNGLRVIGQQPLNAGDVIGIGGVALKVESAAGAGAVKAPASAPIPAAAVAEADDDTAEREAAVEVVDAVEVEEPDDFEINDMLGDAPPADDLGFDLDSFVSGIPLEGDPAPEAEPEAEPAPAKPKKKKKDKGSKKAEASAEAPPPEAEGDDAVAQFLMDLKLDEND